MFKKLFYYLNKYIQYNKVKKINNLIKDKEKKKLKKTSGNEVIEDVTESLKIINNE